MSTNNDADALDRAFDNLRRLTSEGLKEHRLDTVGITDALRKKLDRVVKQRSPKEVTLTASEDRALRAYAGLEPDEGNFINWNGGAVVIAAGRPKVWKL